MSIPIISVVMPSYQQVSFLEEAVRSVLNQQGVTVELLVMDPGSTDGSRELLRSLQDEYGDGLVLHFEPDRGQSDAVNKGMALAKGELLGWLNSDDRLLPEALAKVAALPWNAGPGWVYGRAGVMDEAGQPCSSVMVRYKNWRGRRFTPARLLTENFIPQMAVFWNRAMWQQAGGLDLDRHLAMDYDLWLRFARIAQPKVLPDNLADFRVHSQAKGSLQTGAQLQEAFAVARTHAADYGIKGMVALQCNRLLAIRTRLLYRLMKP